MDSRLLSGKKVRGCVSESFLFGRGPVGGQRGGGEGEGVGVIFPLHPIATCRSEYSQFSPSRAIRQFSKAIYRLCHSMWLIFCYMCM